VRVQRQALVRALARSHRGKSVAQVRLRLRQETRRLGLHLSPAALHGLADSITAGRPLHLP
jgi:tRNA(Phe) wybutosine-synthesizing methylase Tyw3